MNKPKANIQFQFSLKVEKKREKKKPRWKWGKEGSIVLKHCTKDHFAQIQFYNENRGYFGGSKITGCRW